MDASAVCRDETLDQAQDILSKATCLDCPTYKTCNKICPTIEKMLKKETTGRRNWLSYFSDLSKVITQDKVLLRSTEGEGAYYASKGRRKPPINGV
jgi:sulfatase maturation enzyme AslB (radical SAM superfamily)